QRDPLFDEIPKNTLDYMETENAQDVGRKRDIVGEEKENAEDVLSTDKEKVSTNKEKVSTDRQKDSTDEQSKGTDDHTEEGSVTQHVVIGDHKDTTSTMSPNTMVDPVLEIELLIVVVPGTWLETRPTLLNFKTLKAEALRNEFAQTTESLVIKEGAARTSSTNIFSTVSTPAKASSTNLVNTVSIPVSTASPHEGLSLSDPTNPEEDDSEIPPLEDIYQNSTDGIFTTSSYDDEGAVADFTNLETVVNVSPIPTSRIHSTHPRALILGDPNSAVQTRSKVNTSSGAHAFVSYVQKQKRTNHKDFHHCLFACFLSQHEPKKISEALEDESWVDAMQEELLQFEIQKVWVLVDLPYGKKAIGTKWVYRNKKDERGVVVRNKASLSNGCGKIDEEVYVSQPPGFLDPKYPQKVYKVVKALYGLHQAPRAWYATLSTFLLKNGYRRGTIDKTLFLKKDKHDIILVQVYVDDIIFGSTKKSWCDEFEALMKSRFQMSSMGELTFFLGLQVKQKSDGIFISQDKYVAKILKKFDFANVKTASTPIETQKPLVKDEEASDVDVHLYRFQVTPKSSHLSAVKRIFRYLKGKPKLGLWYPKVSSFDLESYSDSDYAGANLDRKSTTGGCQFLGRRLISWQCKKQTIVATSTTEAEYVAAASCCGQVLWIQNQMLDYGFNFMNTKIYIDNESTICIVKNPVYHSKTKHIAIRHHFIRDAYEKKLIQVLKIHTDDNVADLLTKAFDVSSKMAVLDSCPKHNMVAYLEKSEGNEAFHEIIDFLKQSSIHHALTVSPVVSTTFVEQFWTSAKSKTINNVRHITAKVAGKSVSISKASIRSDLLFDDADGIDSLPNQAIFDAIQLMGYEGDLTVLTFNKALFSPQWRFLFHTINHCLSSKSTSWDQIPTNIATAVICLTSNQKYNFSKLIFNGMLRHLDAKKKFVMYPRFISIFLDKQLANVSVPLDHFPVNTLTSKVFSFMVKKGKHFSGKVTPLFATMLVQPTQDEGASSERPSEALPTPSPAPTSEVPNEPQTDSSPAQTSEVPIEQQPDLSPRPSPTPIIPDSIPETSGENLGGHSSSDKSLSGNEGDMTLQSVYDLCLSLCAQSMAEKCLIKAKIPKKELSSIQRDPLFDAIPKDTVDHMETENAQDKGRTRDMVDEDKEIDENILSPEDVLSIDKEGVSTDMEKVSTDRPIVSTDFEKVSTDRPIVSTDGSKVSTDRQIEGTDEQVKGTEEHDESTEDKNEGTEEIFEGTEEQREGTEEKVESTDGQIKNKGKKKIEEEDESESESDGIPQAEKKFKQLESDEELARKVQEEWEAEEERNRITEENDVNEDLIRDFVDIKARIEADRLLAEKLQEQEREQFTIEERAKFLHDTIAAQRKFLAQQRSEAIRNKPPTKNQLRNQMMTYLKHVGNYKHAELKIKKFEEVQALYEKIKRSDEDFISIGSAEDERLIKRMNERGVDLSKSEVIKEESKEEVQEEDKDEESTRKRKLGTRKKMKSRKRRYIQNTSEDESDKENDELRLYLTIAQDEEKEVDYEILDRKYPIKEWKTECLGAKPQTDQAEHLEEINLNVVIRSNGQKRYFSTLMTVLSIFDREDLNAVYQLVMDKYQDEMPEGFDRVLWGDLMVLFNSDDKDEFLESQQDGDVVGMKMYPLRKGKYYADAEIEVRIEEVECWITTTQTMVSVTMLNRHKNWLVHKQTACGKDFSNPFMVDNLPKIVGLSTHLASVVKSWLVHDQNCSELAIPEQTATGKGTSNPLMAGSLPKTTKPT
ncbi:putative ribonuclease H-like domain-containing protein, partial [Tanacetum coccineum]